VHAGQIGVLSNVYQFACSSSGKHRMAIHFEDLPVASPGIAQEAAGRLEKVVHPENIGAGLHHSKVH
jgi:hypothetical protein